MSARKAKTKKRAARQTSNIFAMFDKTQIDELKDAFNMVARDDGFIDVEDLRNIYNSLGQTPSDETLEAMLAEATGPINFTMFLTLMGEKLSGSDPEYEIMQAFECFDENQSGTIPADVLREALTTMGERFTQEEVDIMFKGVKPDAQGNFNYREFVRVLKHGE
ncbi:myosin regulatory light chain 2 [Fonticula alba]|uniref:Myosin regulatory light chain 2 n=1 Tax=Fonticula alba TaxID=691883 RepID=A0A058Z8X8_FONAL|nr:myosin regulatory light chain 2 [Fonticula alba]KCV70383.1 myosin regulatory light chain 2 [Fonticula alba]|eukprot:XP_009494899.1 myosin regulatory light chain 2 [Fonticula alba]